MAEYQFRLQAVLRLREEARDECRQELARAVQAGQILLERRQEAGTELGDTAEQLRHRQSAGQVTVDPILELRRYEMLLKIQMTDLDNKLGQVDAEIERRRQILAEADREVRVLEKLKETQYRAWLSQQQRAEQRALDEVAGQSHHRKTSQEVES